MISSQHPGSEHMNKNFPSANPVPSSLTNAAARARKPPCAASDGRCALTNICHSSTPWTFQLLILAFRYCHRLERVERCPCLLVPSFYSRIAGFLLHDLADVDLSPNSSAPVSPPSYEKARTHRPNDEHVEQPHLLQHREAFTILGIPAAKPQLSLCQEAEACRVTMG